MSRRALLGGLATLPMVRLASGATAHRLSIVYMNDFHARHEPLDRMAIGCHAGDGRAGCYGGAARLATAIAIERAAARLDGRTVMLLDAGDQFQGSLFFTAWKGEVELAVMHAIGTEVMAVGNHEFDDGPATLGRFIRAARFPVVSANIDASAEPSLAGLLRPHVLLDKGLRIGVVGLTIPETTLISSPGPNVRFGAPDTALAREAAACRAAGAKLVIALSHLGVQTDRGLAGQVPGVDVIVGGHSHTLLSDTEDGALGPAHQAIDGPQGRAVVVQAACFGRYIGRLDLDVAEDGTVLAYGGDCRHVALDLIEQPQVAGIVASYAGQLDKVRHRVVGRLDAALDPAVCRDRECALGNLLADAMLTASHGADIAITNTGGIRAGLPRGEVTIGDVLTVLPFGNTLATLKLTGADLLAAIEVGLGRAGGAFPQIAGARLRWDPAAAQGARVVALELRDPDSQFRPVDPARVYAVATNSYMRGGGDGYTVLKERAMDAYDTGPTLDWVMEQALAAATAPATDGRIATR